MIANGPHSGPPDRRDGDGRQAQDLRIGLQDDADVLDPDQSRTFVGRIVYTVAVRQARRHQPELEIVPQLATEWSWSDDGTELTMKLREGVPRSTTARRSTPRRWSTTSIAARTSRKAAASPSWPRSRVSRRSTRPPCKFTLTQPDATLLAQLADRAGMMISPNAAEETGADFGLNPVCSGPYSFVERVQQDRIVLDQVRRATGTPTPIHLTP